MRRTLPLGKFSKQEKKVQTLPSGRTHRILVLVKRDHRTGSQVSLTTQILVLVKGDPRTGSQVSPTTCRFWFWLKGIAGRDLRLAQPHRFWFWLKWIAGRDLRLAQPHTGYWFWLKGITERDLRLAQPHTGYWFWFKEIARWDLRLKKKREKERKEKKKGERKGKKHFKKRGSLDEWILSKLGRQKDKFSLLSLLCKTLRSFCFVSIVKRGHLLLPNF
jgi:hypothetical protein